MRELMAASQNQSMVGIDSRAEGLLLACRGEFARARVAGLAQVRESTARGQGALANIGRTIVAIADLHSGQFEAAVDAASPVIREDPVFTAEETLPELIEAAVKGDHPDVAHSAFAILADRTGTAGTPWALGTRARCKALLAQGSYAEEAYVEAISQLSQSRAAVGLARAHLLYGQWLRRAKRRRDARRELGTAEDMFHAMGAVGFAEQASSELRASGERARKRSPDTELDLTPQESRVATLAAEGSTNAEIAGQLFISPSTVEYHLAKCSESSASLRERSSRISFPAVTEANPRSPAVGGETRQAEGTLLLDRRASQPASTACVSSSDEKNHRGIRKCRRRSSSTCSDGSKTSG